jgi:hypothetical protein
MMQEQVAPTRPRSLAARSRRLPPAEEILDDEVRAAVEEIGRLPAEREAAAEALARIEAARPGAEAADAAALVAWRRAGRQGKDPGDAVSAKLSAKIGAARREATGAALAEEAALRDLEAFLVVRRPEIEAALLAALDEADVEQAEADRIAALRRERRDRLESQLRWVRDQRKGYFVPRVVEVPNVEEAEG